MLGCIRHMSDGMLGALSTIIAAAAAILATWILARGADRRNRQAIAGYAVATIENFRELLWEIAKNRETNAGDFIGPILPRDPSGFATLRANIGLLGVTAARLFIFVDRLAGELQDMRDYPAPLAQDAISEPYDRCIPLYKICVDQLPAHARPKTQKLSTLRAKLDDFRRHRPVAGISQAERNQ